VFLFGGIQVASAQAAGPACKAAGWQPCRYETSKARTPVPIAWYRFLQLVCCPHACQQPNNEAVRHAPHLLLNGASSDQARDKAGLGLPVPPDAAHGLQVCSWVPVTVKQHLQYNSHTSQKH
jgi:hypothetical protein